MIAPASPADWLQGLTMTMLLGGVAIALSRALRPDESPLADDAGPRVDRDSVLVGALDP